MQTETPQILDSSVTVKFAVDCKGGPEFSIRAGLTEEELTDAIGVATKNFASAFARFDWPSSAAEMTEVHCSIHAWFIDDGEDTLMTSLEISLFEMPKEKPVEADKFCAELINKVLARFRQSLADLHVEF